MNPNFLGAPSLSEYMNDEEEFDDSYDESSASGEDSKESDGAQEISVNDPDASFDEDK